MSVKDKWVRRFSVDETARHKNGFTIYKITSIYMPFFQLFPLESPEAVTVVSVWKRYSDVQVLHKSMRLLHAGLHLRGTFPALTRSSYFKRFQLEVIEERAKVIKALLEFIAEHKLLFTSTDFVNFLQTGYPEPEQRSGGVINAIRSSLHLPIEEAPPLEYQTSDDDSRSPTHTARTPQPGTAQADLTDFISQIPIYEAANVELRQSPKHSPTKTLSNTDSFESINSLESINSDLYSELDKLTIDKSKPSIKKTVLPDLINFDAPSTSKFEDYHTMPKTDSDTVSLNSTLYGSSMSVCDDRRSDSRVSLCSKRSVLSLSNLESKTKTEDSYVFEAGYMLNLAARYEDMGEFQRAFECYKAGIEKMLIGVQSDSDPQRRALIKEKTNKYLSYAETIYKNHLCDADQSLLPERDDNIRTLHFPIPISMLKRPYEDLSLYRVLAVLGSSVMLVLHRGDQTCYAMKVIQKIPNNLTEFDEYFLKNTNETRQPILPTVIPYMVPLHSYIETNNLMFLILSYAPGEKLFDYIKNYAKSVPTTPARELNLENVFSEPKNKNYNIKNDNFSSIIEIKTELDVKDFNINDKTGEETSIVDRIEANIENSNNNNQKSDEKTENLVSSEMSVNDLVINSQRLLLNVDKVLSESKVATDIVDDDELVNDVAEELMKRSDSKDWVHVERKVETPTFYRLTPRPRELLPAGALRRWAAELLTALESLHNSGLVCRDLNPSNILLGDRGQIILTYFVGYPGLEMCLAKLPKPGAASMYIAPELYANTHVDVDRDEGLDRVCDYWSYGAVMYELLCGIPLSHYHRSIFTSHTILQLPEGLALEAQSLLTQLLTYEPAERLGAGRDGVEEIKHHPYFRHVDWKDVYDSWIVPD